MQIFSILICYWRWYDVLALLSLVDLRHDLVDRTLAAAGCQTPVLQIAALYPILQQVLRLILIHRLT